MYSISSWNIYWNLLRESRWEIIVIRCNCHGIGSLRCHMCPRSMLIRSKWITHSPTCVVVMRTNEWKCMAIFKSWTIYSRHIYPRSTQHILNKIYTSTTAHREATVSSRTLFVCCGGISFIVTVCSDVRVCWSFGCSLWPKCACWFSLYKRFYAVAAAAAAHRLRFFYTHKHIHAHVYSVIHFCFCIFCVVFVYFKYFILALLWSNGPARRISRDVLFESATSKLKMFLQNIPSPFNAFNI